MLQVVRRAVTFLNRCIPGEYRIFYVSCSNVNIILLHLNVIDSCYLELFFFFFSIKPRLSNHQSILSTPFSPNTRLPHRQGNSTKILCGSCNVNPSIKQIVTSCTTYIKISEVTHNSGPTPPSTQSREHGLNIRTFFYVISPIRSL